MFPARDLPALGLVGVVVGVVALVVVVGEVVVVGVVVVVVFLSSLCSAAWRFLLTLPFSSWKTFSCSSDIVSVSAKT